MPRSVEDLKNPASITHVSLERTPQRHTTSPGFQFMSDLHLEQFGDYNSLDLPQTAPFLILGGDIGRFCDKEKFLAFLRRCCSKWERVMLVPGNHEFYGASREEGLRIADDFQVELGEKFVFLNRGRVDVDDKTVVLGCTLHSRVPDEPKALTNDFARIRDWRVADHNKEHRVDAEWLKEELARVRDARPQSRIIVVTHYAPTYNGTSHPKFAGSELGHCFCSSTLESVREYTGAISHWIFGHTHYNTRFNYDGITVISNQCQGQHEDDRPFDPEASI